MIKKFIDGLCRLISQCNDAGNATCACMILFEPTEVDPWNFTDDVFFAQLTNVGTNWEVSLKNKMNVNETKFILLMFFF